MGEKTALVMLAVVASLPILFGLSSFGALSTAITGATDTADVALGGTELRISYQEDCVGNRISLSDFPNCVQAAIDTGNPLNILGVFLNFSDMLDVVITSIESWIDTLRNAITGNIKDVLDNIKGGIDNIGDQSSRMSDWMDNNLGGVLPKEVLGGLTGALDSFESTTSILSSGVSGVQGVLDQIDQLVGNIKVVLDPLKAIRDGLAGAETAIQEDILPLPGQLASLVVNTLSGTFSTIIETLSTPVEIMQGIVNDITNFISDTLDVMV